MKLFGAGAAAKKTSAQTTKDSIQQLRETIETLEKRERHLQTKIDNEVKLAKLNLSKNKKSTWQKMEKIQFVVALMALKRKKMYEGEVEKIMGARMTLETQSAMLEGANVNLETMNAMKQGAEAMKKIHGAMYFCDCFRRKG